MFRKTVDKRNPSSHGSAMPPPPREGLGSALIGDLLAFLKDAGFRAVRLMYVKGNPQSAAFWTKNGFTPTAVEPKQENYTQVVLERTL